MNSGFKIIFFAYDHLLLKIFLLLKSKSTEHEPQMKHAYAEHNQTPVEQTLFDKLPDFYIQPQRRASARLGDAT
jgi:hypothetical protein